MQQIDLIRIYRSKRALVIDDYPDMRASIRRMLLAFGIDKVAAAASGEDAIDQCREHRFDLILADYNLGEGKNGQQVLEELRHQKLLRHSAIYMLVTAESTRAMVFGAMENQPDDYLTKPFTQTVLQRRLDRLVMERAVLRAVYAAMDKGDFAAAAAACAAQIDAGSRYRQKCLRLKARCESEQGRPDLSAATCRSVIETRPVEWARVELGRALLATGETAEAQSVFEQLVADDCLCLDVYDHLAELRRLAGDAEGARSLLERAVEISPHAFTRQRALATIAEDEGDLERAERAHRKLLRLGTHSMHDSAENYFGLARCVTRQMGGEASDAPRLRQTEEVLRRARRRYREDPVVCLQADLLGTVATAGAGRTREAEERFMQLEDEAVRLALSHPGLGMDTAAGLQALGRKEEAHSLLGKLAEHYADDEQICLNIDRMADAPISARGKERAAALNREGKSLFADKNYAGAIELFAQALALYPSHSGLNLNLLLALVRRINETGVSEELLARAQSASTKLRALPRDHELYARFQSLNAELEKLATAAEG